VGKRKKHCKCCSRRSTRAPQQETGRATKPLTVGKTVIQQLVTRPDVVVRCCWYIVLMFQ
jgi:hypothetical protein